MKDFVIDAGINDVLITSDGQSYIDFVSGYGSVIVGHANTVIIEGLKSQIDKLWVTGKYKHNRLDQACQLIQSFLTKDYYVSELYSTGMEAIEFSLRIAAIKTGRSAYAGFSKSMHGKSLATVSLSWANPFSLSNFYRVPFINSLKEPDLLIYIEKLFKAEKIAAFIIEPIQGSAGGYEASPAFYQSLVELCKTYNVVSVVDEILTGFFRAGHASYCLAHDIYPDIIVFGKSIGNGFPVSAVVLNKDIEVLPNMLPKSTYSSNPLACASVCATLTEIIRLDVREKIQHIHDQVVEHMRPVVNKNFTLRGNGALWNIEPPEGVNSERLGSAIRELGVITAFTDKYIRLLPTATITESNLTSGLEKVAEACVNYS